LKKLVFAVTPCAFGRAPLEAGELATENIPAFAGDRRLAQRIGWLGVKPA